MRKAFLPCEQEDLRKLRGGDRRKRSGGYFALFKLTGDVRRRIGFSQDNIKPVRAINSAIFGKLINNALRTRADNSDLYRRWCLRLTIGNKIICAGTGNNDCGTAEFLEHDAAR